MNHYKATNTSDGSIVEYDADVPQAAYLVAPWVNEMVIVAVDPPGQPVVPPVFIWTAFDFLRRFEVAERIAARTKATTDPVLDDFFSLLMKADNVHSDDPDVIAGMTYCVTVSVLTQARHDTIMSGV